MSWDEASRIAPIHSMDNLPLMHRQWFFRDFEGKLLTLLESMGLPEKQENAIKSYVRNLVWDFARDGQIIPDEIDVEMCESMGGSVGKKPAKKLKS